MCQTAPDVVKARLHRRFCRATQCNFCRAEVATSCDFIAILVQFVSKKRLFRKQKLRACLKVRLLFKVTVFRELHLRDKNCIELRDKNRLCKGFWLFLTLH